MSDDPRLIGAYLGNRESLFPLALKTTLLTILSFGVYRFWERTRIRRYIWSSIAPGGDPFEYSGTGLEKFLGFLIALVALAVILGAMQMGLMFVGLSVFTPAPEPERAILTELLFSLSFLLLAPLLFFAQYRARRYRMARTRWRGIRLGMAPGAWGYVWRACLLSLATALSLGLLWPLMAFRLEKYMADRTWFGDAPLHQGGHWTMLYPALKQIGLALALMLLSIGFLITGTLPFLTVLMIIGSVIWGLLGLVYARAEMQRRLTAHKTLDGTIRFGADFEPGRVLGLVLRGALAVLGFGFLITLGFGLLMAAIGLGQIVTTNMETGQITEPSLWQMGVSILGTIMTLALYGVLALLYIHQPVLAYKVRHIWVENPVGLTAIKQRLGDEMVDAEGFADALDVGGAF